MILAVRKRFNKPPSSNQTKTVQGPNHQNNSTPVVNGNVRHPIGNGGSI